MAANRERAIQGGLEGLSASSTWRQGVLSRQPLAAVGLKFNGETLNLVQIEAGDFPLEVLQGMRPLPFLEWFDPRSRWQLMHRVQESIVSGQTVSAVLKLAIDTPIYWSIQLDLISAGIGQDEAVSEGVNEAGSSSILLFEGAIRDATEETLAVQSLAADKDFTDGVFRLSGIVFCVLDATGRILRYNKAFTDLFGTLDSQTLETCFPSLLFDAGALTRLKHWAYGTKFNETSYSYRLQVETKSGVRRWIAWQVVIDRESANRHFVMTGTDITEQELLQRELESANRHLLMRNDEIKELTKKQKLLFGTLETLRKETDSKGVFNLLAKELKQLINYRNLFFIIKNAESESDYQVFDTSNDFKEDDKHIYFEEFKGVLGKVLLNQTSYYSGNVKSDPNYIVHHPDVNTLALVPIMSRFGLLGALGADAEAVDAFTDVEVEMLKLCAEHLGLYLEELRTRNLLKQQSFQLKDLHGLVTRMMQAGNRQATADLIVLEGIMSHLAIYSVQANVLELLTESEPTINAHYGQPHATALIENALHTRKQQQVRIRSQQLYHTCVPIVHDDIAYGAIYTVHPQALGDHELEVLAIITNQLAMIWRLDDLMAAIREEALMDPLTEMHNRRHIMKRIQEEQHRIERYGGEASLVMLDLTDFKNINDHYGHLVGDEALKAVAKLLRQCIRETDEIGRFGGDEFVLLLPNTNKTAAEEMVQRMQALLEATPVTEKHIVVRGDFGIVTMPEDAVDGLSALRMADGAMYSQKRRTKDR